MKTKFLVAFSVFHFAVGFLSVALSGLTRLNICGPARPASHLTHVFDIVSIVTFFPLSTVLLFPKWLSALVPKWIPDKCLLPLYSCLLPSQAIYGHLHYGISEPKPKA